MEPVERIEELKGITAKKNHLCVINVAKFGNLQVQMDILIQNTYIVFQRQDVHIEFAVNVEEIYNGTNEET